MIGVGAIGRQVALQLTAIGIPWLQLVDFDMVEPSNLASQGYWEEDLGRSKVETTADLCRKINEGLDVFEIVERFRRTMDIGNVVFCCVDSIRTRQLIWGAVEDKVLFFCDGYVNLDLGSVACRSTHNTGSVPATVLLNPARNSFLCSALRPFNDAVTGRCPQPATTTAGFTAGWSGLLPRHIGCGLKSAPAQVNTTDYLPRAVEDVTGEEGSEGAAVDNGVEAHHLGSGELADEEASLWAWDKGLFADAGLSAFCGDEEQLTAPHDHREIRCPGAVGAVVSREPTPLGGQREVTLALVVLLRIPAAAVGHVGKTTLTRPREPEQETVERRVRRVESGVTDVLQRNLLPALNEN